MNQTPVRALSVIQPWADCIVKWGKNIENRSWNTKFRGYFAVHASRACDLKRFDVCEEEYGISIDSEKVAYGAIVGFAELVDVVTEESLTQETKKWFMGEFGFVLTNVIRLKKPIPVKGALSFWTLEGAALIAALSQLSVSQKKKVLTNGLKKDIPVRVQERSRIKRRKINGVSALTIYSSPGFKKIK